jgi:hypothetical protein
MKIPFHHNLSRNRPPRSRPARRGRSDRSQKNPKMDREGTEDYAGGVGEGTAFTESSVFWFAAACADLARSS